MAKILFAGLFSAQNLGDKVIATCAMDIYAGQLREMGIESAAVEPLDLVPRKSQHLVMKCVRAAIYLMRRYVSRSIADRILTAISSRDAERQYSNALAEASLVVVVGGGLIKYKYEMFWLYIKTLISTAEATGTCVILNAVGIEGYDASNDRCLHLKDALSSRAVAAITTRDDIHTLLTEYMDGNPQIHCKRTPDPAVLCGEIYGSRRRHARSLIGVGLVRGHIFEANGVPVSPHMLIQLYSNILSTLDERELDWKLFTNGMPADMELADRIIARLDSARTYAEVAVPTTDSELVSIISGFNGVIAARLHANIISYSLGIPSIGLAWNPKLHFFGKNMGHPERIIDPPHFDSHHIVSRLEQAMADGNDPMTLLYAKQTVKMDVRACLECARNRGAI